MNSEGLPTEEQIPPQLEEQIQQQQEEQMEEYFTYLDALRESGVTNMYGAGPYLRNEFGLDRNESHRVLQEWMETFEKRHPIG